MKKGGRIMTIRRGRLWAAGILGLALATPALAAGDGDLRERIAARLARAHLDASADIQVEVSGGVAHLSGLATRLEDARRAEREARRETRQVANDVRVEPERRNDGAVRKDAETAVLRYPRYEVWDAVGVDVADGVATLRGWVLQPWRSSEIEDRVAQVPGLRAVRNELQVQGFSTMDERLRRELYARIYGHPLFETYAGRFDKPVRIIVENGRVVLAGTVGSAVEQAVVGHIARGTLAFAVDNQVQIEGQHPADARPKAKGTFIGI
jgi:hyperosmotically inducible protein